MQIETTSNELQEPVTTEGRTGSQSPTAPWSVYGTTPVVQPAGTGNTHTVTAGSSTAVYTNTTFDGSIGSSAYTVGDIVKALKSVGLLA